MVVGLQFRGNTTVKVCDSLAVIHGGLQGRGEFGAAFLTGE